MVHWNPEEVDAIAHAAIDLMIANPFMEGKATLVTLVNEVQTNPKIELPIVVRKRHINTYENLRACGFISRFSELWQIRVRDRLEPVEVKVVEIQPMNDLSSLPLPDLLKVVKPLIDLASAEYLAGNALGIGAMAILPSALPPGAKRISKSARLRKIGVIMSINRHKEGLPELERRVSDVAEIVYLNAQSGKLSIPSGVTHIVMDTSERSLTLVRRAIREAADKKGIEVLEYPRWNEFKEGVFEVAAIYRRELQVI